MKKAHDQLNSNASALLLQALQSSTDGAALLTQSAVHLARFADEEIGNARMKAASHFRKDAGIPTIIFNENGDIATIKNSAQLGKHISSNVVQESISHVSEAVAVWTDCRVEEAAEDVSECLKEITAVVEVQDFGLFMVLYEATVGFP